MRTRRRKQAQRSNERIAVEYIVAAERLEKDILCSFSCGGGVEIIRTQSIERHHVIHDCYVSHAGRLLSADESDGGRERDAPRSMEEKIVYLISNARGSIYRTIVAPKRVLKMNQDDMTGALYYPLQTKIDRMKQNPKLEIQNSNNPTTRNIGLRNSELRKPQTRDSIMQDHKVPNS